jgi:hypothetical protein
MIKSRMRRAGNVESRGKKKNKYKILVRKPERKRPHVRQRHRREASIKMCIKEIEWKGMDCIHLAQDTDKCKPAVNIVTNFCVLLNAGYFLTSSGTVSF